MKIRNGFVSNSSSSSFICQICNATETGFDADYHDFGFIRCENGHMFCETHLIDVEESKEADVPNDDYDITEVKCPICSYQELSYSDIKRYFLKETAITIDEVFQEIKKVNKRRKKVYDNEYVEYVLRSKNITTDDLLNTLKTQYPKYTDFLTSLN